MASLIQTFASRTAVSSSWPFARPAAMAAEREQPVPCVLRVTGRGAVIATERSASKKWSTLSVPCPRPPLINTAPQPMAINRLPWLTMSASPAATGSPSKAAAVSVRSSAPRPHRRQAGDRLRLPPLPDQARRVSVTSAQGRPRSPRWCRDGRHPDLDGPYIEIGEYRVELGGDEFGRYLLDSAHAGGVLRGQSRYRGSAVDARARQRSSDPPARRRRSRNRSRRS